MPKTISAEQYERLSESNFTGNEGEFHALLEEYTGIEARPYSAYQYFDAGGNFLADSDETYLDDLLDMAEIEVESGGM